jgi:hypothetical protein
MDTFGDTEATIQIDGRTIVLSRRSGNTEYPESRCWKINDLGLPVEIDGVPLPSPEFVEFSDKAKLALFNSKFRSTAQKTKPGARRLLEEILSMPSRVSAKTLSSLLWDLLTDHKRGGFVNHPRKVMDLLDIAAMVLVGASPDIGLQRLFTKEFRQVIGSY